MNRWSAHRMAVRSLSILFVLSTALPLFAQPRDGGGENSDRSDRGDSGRGRRGGGGGRGFGGPGGGGFPGGGGGRGGGGVMGELYRESSKKELDISADQQAKIDDLMETRREQMRSMFRGGGNGGRNWQDMSDEERQTAMEEGRKAAAKQQAESEASLKEILDDKQFKRLNELTLHHSGPGVLARDEKLSEEFDITADQKTALEKVQGDYFSSMRELGFGATSEERDKLRAEYDGKYLAILTPDQQKLWSEKLGPPPLDEEGKPTAAGTTTSGVKGAPPKRAFIELPVEGPVVASLSPVGSDGKPVERPSGAKTMSFNFSGAPWMETLQLFAKQAGLTLDLRDVPSGTFTYYDSNQYTPTEALDVLNGYLQQRGFVLIQRDQALVCLNYDEGVPPNLIPIVPVEELKNRGKNELLTVVFPLDGVDVTKVEKDVAAIRDPNGVGVVHGLPTTNSLMVTDTGANLQMIAKMLGAVTPSGASDQTFKPYRLAHISADEAAMIVRAQLGVVQKAPNVSSASGAGNDFGRRGGGFGGFGGGFGGGGFGRQQPPQQQGPTTPVASTAIVEPESRTNMLLVSATPSQHKIVDEVLKVVDVDMNATGGLIGGHGGKPYLKVYKINSSDTRDVTRTLDAMVPGVVVNEDTSAQTIHVNATEAEHHKVEELIRQLDGGGGHEVAVIPLSMMDPLNASTTLRSMFVRDGSSAPTIEPDLYSRQIMVRGTTEQVAQVRKLLASLGEDGTGKGAALKTGKLRTFSLNGRDASEILPMVERLWDTQSKTTIRIVSPQNRGPIRGVRTPSYRQSNDAPYPDRGDEPTRSESHKGSPRDRAESLPGSSIRDALISMQNEAAVEAELKAGKPVAAEADQSADAIQDLLKGLDDKDKGAGEGSDAEVTVTVMGDELILSSADEKALDKLEAMLQSALQAVPPRTAWTVFTLQTADATEAALLLRELVPDSQVAQSSSSSSSSGMFGGFAGGFSALGNNLANMTGLNSTTGSTLRIIPDVRLNALFVTGPASRVQEVEQMLQVLDATDLGSENLRDRMPRMIAVEHADIDEVFSMVRDTYKDYMQSEQPQQQQQQNPFAAMMGGNNRNNRQQQQQQKAQLALAVDRRSNNLIVSASESLFIQIEGLVKSIDKSAKEAERTVRVLQVQNVDPSLLQTSLGTMLPNVQVNAVQTGRSNRRSDAGNGAAPNVTPQPNQGGQNPFTSPFGNGGRGGQNPFGGNGGQNPFGGGGNGRGGFGGGQNPFGGGGFGRGGTGFGGGGAGGRGFGGGTGGGGRGFGGGGGGGGGNRGGGGAGRR